MLEKRLPRLQGRSLPEGGLSRPPSRKPSFLRARGGEGAVRLVYDHADISFRSSRNGVPRGKLQPRIRAMSSESPKMR